LQSTPQCPSLLSNSVQKLKERELASEHNYAATLPKLCELVILKEDSEAPIASRGHLQSTSASIEHNYATPSGTIENPGTSANDDSAGNEEEEVPRKEELASETSQKSAAPQASKRLKMRQKAIRKETEIDSLLWSH